MADHAGRYPFVVVREGVILDTLYEDCLADARRMAYAMFDRDVTVVSQASWELSQTQARLKAKAQQQRMERRRAFGES